MTSTTDQLIQLNREITSTRLILGIAEKFGNEAEIAQYKAQLAALRARRVELAGGES